MSNALSVPSIDEIVFRVAVEYENLNRRKPSTVDWRATPLSQRPARIAKTGISYVIRNEKEFLLYLLLTPYTIQVDGDHYLFGSIPVGGKFRTNGKSLMFTGSPKVLRAEHYHHPLVYADNTIDFSCSDRWSRADVRWGCWYDLTKEDTAHKIAVWLEIGRKALQNGYLKGIVIPVHLLSRDNFPSEYRTYEGAIKSGV
ncbi:MAG: hypothetical protein KKC75_08360 [Nanoarchaeota archaeon]|nr:hypothetical protein [Nanoarchaeota archaeon]MBU1004484.1 hypothetical protein [Nanoarchaeota archaeon]MBU1945654.1 hypothetical protein [Nanoarchaeota archaeon]